MQGFKNWNPLIVMIVMLFSVHGQVEVPAWIFKIFVPNQLLLRCYEKVILWPFFQNVSVLKNYHFNPLQTEKSNFLKRTPREFNFFSSPIFAYKIIAKYQKIRNCIFKRHLDLMKPSVFCLEFYISFIKEISFWWLLR